MRKTSVHTHVVTHRGLDPDRGPSFPSESSHEAFENHLIRGYGIEFDIRSDLVIAHDDDFQRITRNGCHLIALPELLDLIQRNQAASMISAMHVKADSQDESTLDKILDSLESVDASLFFIFDLKIEYATYMTNRRPELQLACSVSHPYDIERYNCVVGGTLYDIETAIKHKSVFNWVWLDEWDLLDKNGNKKFYTAENFNELRRHGFKIALVTPELHSTSPGLLGGETHGDAKPPERLYNRIREILDLKPDLVCTDHPDIVAGMVRH